MTNQVEGKWVVPNPRVPQTFGTLNIVFGAILLLFGIYSIAMLYFGPRIQAAMLGQIKEQQAVTKSQRDAKIADLKKKEEAAKSKEEKQTIADEREAMEKSVDPDISSFMADAMSMANDPRIVMYSIVEGSAGILLNILMLISGIGLLKLTDWARRMALGVAWLKIARWITIVGFTLVVVVPITTEKMEKMFQTIEAQAKAKSGGARAPLPMVGLSQFTAAATAVTTVIMALIAVIYPVLSLWFLTRPTTIAAILARSKLESTAPDFDLGATT